MRVDEDLQMINQRYSPNISPGINAAIKTLLTPTKEYQYWFAKCLTS